MMKRILLAIMLFGFSAMVLFSQSLLTTNENYKKIKELKQLQMQAYEDADYPEVTRLGDEIDHYTDLLSMEIEEQLTAYRARSALVRLKDRLAELSRWKAATDYPMEMAEGQALYEQSYKEFYTDKDHAKSLSTSNRALDMLSVIQFAASDSESPAYYVVRLLPGNTDCLWNIAGYDFIYGDPWKWKLIYEANKSKLPQMENPHLILPDMVLTIPSMAGEERSGTWEEGIVR